MEESKRRKSVIVISDQESIFIQSEDHIKSNYWIMTILLIDTDMWSKVILDQKKDIII